MSLWRVDLKEEAVKDFASLDKPIRESVVAKLEWFVNNIGQLPLIPLKGDLSKLNKLRVGDWRVLYRMNNDTLSVEVFHIEHRSKAYKRRKRG